MKKKWIVSAIAGLVLLTISWVCGEWSENTNIVPRIWGSACAVQVDLANANDTGNGYYYLPDKHGKEIGLPADHLNIAYAIQHNSLIYWSKKDDAVCIAKADGKCIWHTVPTTLLDSSNVYSLYASSSRIYLNTIGSDGKGKVICLDPASNRWFIVAPFVEVRAHDNSDNMVGVLSNGSVDFQANNATDIVHLRQFNRDDVEIWDAEANDKVICWRDGWYVWIYHNGRLTRSVVGNSMIPCISICPQYHAIWVPEDLHFLIFARVMVFGYNGEYIGHSGITGPMSPPLYLYDARTSGIARSLSTTVKP